MIPGHIKASIDRYVKDRVPTGSFLHAVLTNNLFRAVARADNENLSHLPEIVTFVYNEIPSACWGSPEKVKEWLANRPEVEK